MGTSVKGKLPVTVVIAARNEEVNLAGCLDSVSRAQRVILVDSHSDDRTVDIARDHDVDVVQFDYVGGYPRKRQWAIDTQGINTDWIMLLDADERVPEELWEETERKMDGQDTAFLCNKEFHFLGRRLRFGGFSHSAVLLFRRGKARFERLVDDVDDGFDMEVHERLHVDGSVGKFRTPLIHNDAKSVDAYIDRHRGYAKWEARARYNFLKNGSWGEGVDGKLFGDIQKRRRFLKGIAMRVPFEPLCWFLYHYVFMLGFLEGRAGLLAAKIRAQYISWVRANLKELVDA